MAIYLADKTRILNSLASTIEGWIDKNTEDLAGVIGWIGDDTSGYMALAAMNVLESLSDLNQTLKDNGELK